jgi:hypothetical protein
MWAETTGNTFTTKNCKYYNNTFKKSDDASVDILATNELFYLNILKHHSHHVVIAT